MMQTDQQVRVSLTGDIRTAHQGLTKLVEFEQSCQQYQDCSIAVDLQRLQWLDANLSAVFGAMMHRLHQTRHLDFTFDSADLRGRFSILARNGFSDNLNVQLTDGYGTAIRLRRFDAEEDEGFNVYIDQQLLAHAKLQLHPNLRSDMMLSFNEVFTNVSLHANTTNPLFTCGQYYPSKQKLHFSLVDLGVGYLKPIQQHNAAITSHTAAIQWALEAGHTTRQTEEGYYGVVGGHGLSKLHQYCCQQRGELQIISGNAFWSSLCPDSCQLIEPFQGSIVNIKLPCPK